MPDVNILVLNKTSKSSSRSGIPVSNGLKYKLEFHFETNQMLTLALWDSSYKTKASSAKPMSVKKHMNLKTYLVTFRSIIELNPFFDHQSKEN